jgi:hypothetical protein
MPARPQRLFELLQLVEVVDPVVAHRRGDAIPFEMPRALLIREPPLPLLS